MRKDVKFGLTIGAVLVVTLVVYVIVLSRGGSAPQKIALALPGSTDQPAGPSDSTSLPGSSQPRDGANPYSGEQPETSVTPNTDATTPAPTSADPSAPATQPASAAGSDTRTDWDGALSRGLPPSMSASAAPEHTVTPMIDSPASGAPRGPTGVNRPFNVPVIDSLPTTQPSQQFANDPMLLSAAPSSPVSASRNLATAQTPRTHRVASGESPYTIAEEVYGNGKYYKKIMAANPGVDARRLKIGQVLNIPELSDVERNPAPASAASADGSAGADSPSAYTVKPGDSLESISRKLYGGPGMIDKLYDANKSLIGPDENVLKVGWVLKLPEAPNTTTAAR